MVKLSWVTIATATGVGLAGVCGAASCYYYLRRHEEEDTAVFGVFTSPPAPNPTVVVDEQPDCWLTSEDDGGTDFYPARLPPAKYRSRVKGMHDKIRTQKIMRRLGDYYEDEDDMPRESELAAMAAEYYQEEIEKKIAQGYDPNGPEVQKLLTEYHEAMATI